MRLHNTGWIDALSTNDGQALWANLFRIISKHSAVRVLYLPRGISGDGLTDVFSDLTQELFLKLHEKDRFRCYLADGYSDQDVEQELHRIEVPNLVSNMQRQRYPESYRLARRISDLLQTHPKFKPYTKWGDAADEIPDRRISKLALKIYGLSSWPAYKHVRPIAGITDVIRDVAFRPRDTRRTGRGQGSQVIISNEELSLLTCDIFAAIDTPAEVRTIRSLVLSKLPIEDCKLVYIDATVGHSDAEPTTFKVDLPDDRPTPLEILLQKEATNRMDRVADELIEGMRKAVRNRPYRFRKLIEVVWHCYFNHASPTQSSTATEMGISDSLVSHYRRIFDSLVQELGLAADELLLLNSALEKRLPKLRDDLHSSERGERTKVIASARVTVRRTSAVHAASLCAGQPVRLRR